MDKIRSDLLCENCSERESTHLLYHEKYEQEIGKYSLINPSIICTECTELFKNVNELFETRPRLIPFEEIVKWDGRMMGFTSKKLYEFSCFRHPWFKKKIWRIKFACQPKKKKPIDPES